MTSRGRNRASLLAACGAQGGSSVSSYLLITVISGNDLAAALPGWVSCLTGDANLAPSFLEKIAYPVPSAAKKNL